MTRGLLFFFIQLFVGFSVTALGMWALIGPKRLQGFLNENYDLLPAVKPRSLVTVSVIRLVGIGLIFYGITLLSNFKAEMTYLGKAFGVISN